MSCLIPSELLLQNSKDFKIIVNWVFLKCTYISISILIVCVPSLGTGTRYLGSLQVSNSSAQLFSCLQNVYKSGLLAKLLVCQSCLT